MDYRTPQFYRVMAYAARADRNVVDMVSGSPDWGPPDALREGLREYADRPAADYAYGPSEGLRPLREAIGAEHGVDVERVLVTNGTGEANHLAMAGGLEAFPGDEVVLTDPVYPYYAGRAALLGAETTYVGVDAADHLDPDALRAAVSQNTAVVVVNTPNNPTGAVYDADAMAAFVAIAEANDALLVSDEVYRRFDYRGMFASALDVGDRSGGSANVVVTDGFSKSLAITGLRVGYAVFPPTDAGAPPGLDGDQSLLDRARTRHMLTNVTGSRPAQYAVGYALDEMDSTYYETNRERLRDRIEAFGAALDDCGATWIRPEGAFYVLADLPTLGGAFEDAYALVDDAGVAGMPGEAFGEQRAGHLRFSLTTDRVAEAADRLKDHLG